MLLVIPGMPADAGFYSGVARRLAGSFTVVSFDPRGMSRSRLDGPPEDQRVEVHADDAGRVLDAVGGGPAHVLGDSNDPEDPVYFVVMHDPAGNEFCVG